jgi:hypothetical protein
VGREPSPRLGDCEGSTALARGVRRMSAIGTEEMIDWPCHVVGLLGQG